MYFPYLRGRQNELLCLRELLEMGKLGKEIMPVIEPVRFNGTFFSTITKFIEMNRDLIVIGNPKVGSFHKEYFDMKRRIEMDDSKKEKVQNTLDHYIELLKDRHIRKAYIVDHKIIAEILKGELNVKELVLINFEDGNYRFYEEYSEKLMARFTFIPKDEDFKDEVDGETIVLEDGYRKARNNAAYIESPDEFFSRNHVIYRRRGYSGFSDFSIVGNEFEESGFAPKAIAIHIAYFGNKNELRVHHFVSESNESITDPARKFEEAMNHLLHWEQFELIPKTVGLSSLIECYNMGKFPGLGVIKKYSLMHHIEMMGEYLGEN